MQYAINPALDNQIRRVLAGHRHITLAVLFGSLAAESANFDSDIDLAVSADRCLNAQEKIQLIEDLAIELGRPVDLIDLYSVGEPLLGQIIIRGRKVIGDNTRFANMLTKHLFNQADFMPYRNRILQERRRAWLAH